MSNNSISHDELKRAILNKYCAPFWCALTEVKDKTGFGWSRSADVIAFGMYASRGYEIHMFECKASRGDWLGELKDPSKAQVIAQEVDKIWIVAPKGVVQKEELPLKWGLLTVKRKGDGFTSRVTKQALQIDKNGGENIISRSFCAAVLYQSLKDKKKFILREDMEGELKAEYKRGFKRGESNWEHQEELRSLRGLQSQVDKFEEASGIKIDRYYGAADLGAKVKAITIMENLGRHVLDQLKQTKSMAERCVEQVDIEIKKVEDSKS